VNVVEQILLDTAPELRAAEIYRGILIQSPIRTLDDELAQHMGSQFGAHFAVFPARAAVTDDRKRAVPAVQPHEVVLVVLCPGLADHCMVGTQNRTSGKTENLTYF
jgi:hypothetical protein